MTVREFIAKLEALPEDQKDLQVTYPSISTNPFNELVQNVKVAPADYGFLISIT